MNKYIKILTIINVIILLATVYLFVLNRQSANEIQTLSTKLNALSNESSKTEALKSDVTELQSDLAFQRIAHTVEGALTTDDFVVDRLNFSTGDTDKLQGISLNLSAQPRMALLYKESGRFDISDRELRAKLEPLVPEIKDYYSQFEKALPWGDDVEADIYVKNYKIATYKNGKLTLAGE